MDRDLLGILREAQRIRQRKEELERAIGRTVRKSGGDFKVYAEIVTELRETAGRSGMSIDEVAESLLETEQSEDDEGDH